MTDIAATGAPSSPATPPPTITAPPPPRTNGQSAMPQAAPPDPAMQPDQQLIVTQQQVLICNQAQLVRDLEAQLRLNPPGPPPLVSINPANDLQPVIDIQTAAIRTQAAYTKHLLDLFTALSAIGGIAP